MRPLRSVLRSELRTPLRSLNSFKAAAAARAKGKSNLQKERYTPYSVASGGSLDNDGYNDLVVGAPFWYNGQIDEGKVFAFDNSGSGVTSTIWWSLESDEAGALLGYSVACGKLDSDSYADVFVGAPYYNGGDTDRGIGIFYKSTGSTLSQDASHVGTTNNGHTGMKVATGYVEGGVLGFITATPDDSGGTVAVWECTSP